MSEVRILHHFAASGGTIFTRCLAAMPAAAVLSEQHPDRWLRGPYDPFVQARFGYSDWITEADLDVGFLSEISVMLRAAERTGRVLVVRDWTHTDFIDSPTLFSRTAEVLGREHKLVRAATIRHPIDNWIAMNKNGFLRISIGEYVKRYSAFLDMTEGMPVLKYEALCREPDETMKSLCDALRLPFASDYLSRVPQIRWITGASGRQSDVPSPRPREPIAQGDLAELVNDPLLASICARAGYEIEPAAPPRPTTGPDVRE